MDTMSYNCDICGNKLQGRWTDLHGEMTCSTCGTPYLILHYDKDHNRISKEPEVTIWDWYIPHLKTYWNDRKRNMGLGTWLLRNPRQSDYDAFIDWLDENVAPPGV